MFHVYMQDVTVLLLVLPAVVAPIAGSILSQNGGEYWAILSLKTWNILEFLYAAFSQWATVSSSFFSSLFIYII